MTKKASSFRFSNDISEKLDEIVKHYNERQRSLVTEDDELFLTNFNRTSIIELLIAKESKRLSI